MTHIQRISPDLGWGWRPFLFAINLRLGRPIVHVVDDRRWPEDQRQENEPERLHRLRQLGQNVNGLLLGMTSPW
ncbi:MAG: hypothetical protein H0W08_24475 [Acidobacteria bacterium]|nr:hypothetical protein [Acidobacteriota bacterium]